MRIARRKILSQETPVDDTVQQVVYQLKEHFKKSNQLYCTRKCGQYCLSGQ